MILVDGRVGSVELIPQLQRIGIKVEKGDLVYGDACFEGRNPTGDTISVGVERKTLHDMLNCIDDARYAALQRPGMKMMYDISILNIEGHWKPHDNQGILMEGFNGGITWGPLRYRQQKTMYSKLYRYLISVSLSGVLVTYSRDLYGTAYNIHELYHYFQKRDHTSMIETQKIAIPSWDTKPPLIVKWANAIEDIGVKLGFEAQRLFKTPIALAQGDELDWLKIRGVGVKTAQKIYREIRGIK